MKNILITGSEGFVGRSLSKELVNFGNVYTLDRKPSNYMNHVCMDLNDFNLNSVLKDIKPNLVIHLAAQTDVRTSLENPQLDFKDNVLATFSLLNSLDFSECNKIIYANSGGAIYSPDSVLPIDEGALTKPLSPYGFHKLMSEQIQEFYCNMHNIDFISLAFSNIYGSHQLNNKGVMFQFFKQMKQNSNCIVNGALTTRDFIYIKDVIRAFEMSIKSSSTGRFNISSGHETSLRDLFELMKKVIKSDSNLFYGESIKGEIVRSCLSNEKAKKFLNWNPIYSIEDGLYEAFHE